MRLRRRADEGVRLSSGFLPVGYDAGVTDYLLEIEGADEDLVQARLFLTATSGSTSADGVVTAYFDTRDERDAAAELLRGLGEIRAIERERVDWLDLYQQSLQPLFIGERFVVAPDASLIDSDRLALVIPQEQAFGTGSHATTSLCIELLESADLRGKRGLDVGAGSGILALAMLRLGAQHVVAFDNDLDALAALRDNRARNGFGPPARQSRADAQPSMSLFIGTIEALPNAAFDVVTINIVPEVIIPVLPHVRAKELVVSGVLIERRDEVVAAMRGYRIVAERTKGEWWAALSSRA
jgi:ribosomal protein L11 methyltransferase